MSIYPKINTLFVDIGGVLLTNGWGKESRKSAANHFSLDFADMEERHHLTYSIYEEGKLTLEEYLHRVIFFQKREFTKEEFTDFMFTQSCDHPKMISLVKELKAQYNLKIAVVNNEARELNEFRISKFGLNKFVDFFISSCFIHIRKPNADIFRIALDIAQVSPDSVAYLEDRKMFVDVASELGIRSIHHKNYESTAAELASLGLVIRQTV
jgi:putative hydrolase of the HAD superfamily